MKNIIYISSLLLALMSWSCDDILDITPQDSIGDEEVFESIEDIRTGVNGLYASLYDHNHTAVSSYASDDLRLSSENKGQGVGIHNWEFTPITGTFSSIWTDMYHTVDRANRLMLRAQDFDQEDERIKMTYGECLFIRAYCHFQLVRAFCDNFSETSMGIPYMSESVVSEPGRLPQNEVYKLLYADLNAAYQILQETEGSRPQLIYASSNAALALKARVALYQKDWNSAIEFATNVIDSSGIVLADTSQVEDLWNDGTSADVIFKLKREGARLGDLYSEQGSGELHYEPSNALMNMFTFDDKRRAAYFTTSESSQKPKIGKHDGREDGVANLVDIKILRMAEIYLIRAEAYTMIDQLTEATADIDTLRKNRIQNPLLTPALSKEAVLKAVQDERRREMCYEGHRFFDLRRWSLGITRMPEDLSSTTQPELAASDFRFVLPIPESELLANEHPDMKQNRGYN